MSRTLGKQSSYFSFRRIYRTSDARFNCRSTPFLSWQFYFPGSILSICPFLDLEQQRRLFPNCEDLLFHPVLLARNELDIEIPK